jgi:anti-sigma factor RsiW
MMEHLEDRLQSYLDGALSPEEERAARAHLDGCAACRTELALLREVDDALRAWPVLPEPEGLAARVMAEVRASPGSATRPGPATPPPWVAPWPWLRVHWSEVLLGAALVATAIVLVVSLRAWTSQDALDLRFWDIQVQRALAEVERSWYAIRADAGRVGADGIRPGKGVSRPARYAAQFYCWVAGAVALLAGVASVGVLAQQWRRGLRVTT